MSRRTGPRVDLTGRQFGRWTVLGLGSRRRYGKSKIYRYFWRCKCQCGRVREVNTSSLNAGQSNSCRSCDPTHRPRHGARTNKKVGVPSVYNPDGTIKKKRYNRIKEYQTWNNISICAKRSPVVSRMAVPIEPAWTGRDGYVTFLRDMGRIKFRHFRLERIDRSLGYVRGNCVWRKWREPVPRTFVYQGEDYTIGELAFLAGVQDRTMRNWLVVRGLTPAVAVARGQGDPLAWEKEAAEIRRRADDIRRSRPDQTAVRPIHGDDARSDRANRLRAALSR